MLCTDTQILYNNHVDVGIVLSKLKLCLNDPRFDLHGVFFAIHDMALNDVSLTNEDVISVATSIYICCVLEIPLHSPGCCRSPALVLVEKL
jgi:hypothetical protein